MIKNAIFPVIVVIIGLIFSGICLFFPNRVLSLAGRWTKFLYYEIGQYNDDDIEKKKLLLRDPKTGRRSDYIRRMVEFPSELPNQVLLIRLIGVGIGVVAILTLILLTLFFLAQ